MTTKISITNLLVYIKRRPLYRVSLDVPHPAFVQVKGLNGAGKTTFLKALIGLCKTEGEKSIVWKQDNSRELYTGYVRDFFFYHCESEPFPFLTTLKNLIFWFKLFNVKHDMSSSIFQQFSMEDKKNLLSCSLSSGEKKKLCLSKLLLVEKKFWFLDEPTNYLDETSLSFLKEIFQEHIIKRKGIIFCSTHQNIFLKNVPCYDLIISKEKS